MTLKLSLFQLKTLTTLTNDHGKVIFSYQSLEIYPFMLAIYLCTYIHIKKSHYP